LKTLQAEADAHPLPRGPGELPAARLDLRPVLLELLMPAAHLQGEFERVFGLVTARDCLPFETEYHPSADPFFCAQQMADVAGFYRAFGLEPTQAAPERPDHLALELEFMAFLLRKQRQAHDMAGAAPQAAEYAQVCEEAQRAFFRDHLAWWVPAFATGLRRKAGDGFYAAVSQVLAALLPLERALLDVAAPRRPVALATVERPEEEPGCDGCEAGLACA
jgi:TorA maturation chaperone TorD